MVRIDIIDSLKAVVDKAVDIEQILKLTNMKGIQYLPDYKLDDLKKIQSLVRKCVICHEYYLPNPVTKRLQVYCSPKCRNTVIKSSSVSNLDKYKRPLDLIRKNIYIRRYRAQKDNKYFNEAEYSAILKRIQVLLKNQKYLSDDEYFKQIDDITDAYELAIKRQRYETEKQLKENITNVTK